MPTLLFRFPGGRYHATPWGHHVNEGLIEWPPSPWRLLRALLSVGYTRLGWAASLQTPWQSQPPETACALLLKLAGTLPRYGLPPAGGAHSRHYMPVAAFKGDREHTTLVFDTWAQVDEGVLAVGWDVQLTAAETQMLHDLVSRLSYLGRSESWVEGRVASPEEAAAIRLDCLPCDVRSAPGPGWEQVALLAPEPGPVYAAWRATRLEAALANLPALALPDKKTLTAKDRKPVEQREAERVRAEVPYPADLLACLQTDTNWQRDHGWSQPPGSRRVLYWRAANALRSVGLPAAKPAIDGDRMTFVLLAMSTESGNNHALPTLARSLPQGELLHRTLVSLRQRLCPDLPAPVLTGCDAQRRPLRGKHGHAHVLSLDLDDDGHLDHVLVWAPDGLDRLDQQALRATRKTFTKRGAGELRLSWAAGGSREDLLNLPEPWRSAVHRTVGAARTWVSATPFVLPRHPKPRGANSVEGQLRAELRARDLPEPLSVEVLQPQQCASARQLRHHVRVRQHGPQPVVNAGLAVRLTFSVPVEGPICLGYASHFGLGRFEPASVAAD